MYLHACTEYQLYVKSILIDCVQKTMNWFKNHTWSEQNCLQNNVPVQMERRFNEVTTIAKLTIACDMWLCYPMSHRSCVLKKKKIQLMCLVRNRDDHRHFNYCCETMASVRCSASLRTQLDAKWNYWDTVRELPRVSIFIASRTSACPLSHNIYRSEFGVQLTVRNDKFL